MSGETKTTIRVGDIPFSKNIVVASNELFLRATINRNTEKLLSNDIYLHQFIEAFKQNGDYTILPWKNNTFYKKGDVVIFTEYDRDKVKILNLYILQSLVDNNGNEPEKKVEDGYIADFSESGWENLNPFFSLYYSDDEDFNLSNYLEYALSNRFEISHELDLNYHRFGKIESHEISSVILNKSMENIADERETGLWPYEIVNISNPAYHGTMKKWGMGVVEYDITYKLLGSNMITRLNESGEIEKSDFIAANSYMPVSSEWNDKYFLSKSDYSIFMVPGSNKIENINGIYQTNLSEQMNVYHGKLEFPIPFIDTNYMIFTSNRTTDGNGIQCPNTVTFADKTESSVEVIYAIPNYNKLPIEKVALRNNEFQCQIIGRWKRGK